MLHLNLWELLIILNLTTTIVIHLVKHGERRDGEYSFFIAILSSLISFFILYKAGLFH